MRGVTARILDVVEPHVERPLPAGTEGQVAIRADSMLDRYLGEDSPPTVDGFFLTGDLGLTKVASPIAGLQNCWLQKEPARSLLELGRIPILVAAGEASYHAQYDHCTSEFLRQAGVPNTYVNLASVGIRGNGHMQMLEQNNLQIASFYEDWLVRKLR